MNHKNVLRYAIGKGSLGLLPKILNADSNMTEDPCIYLFDHFFEGSDLPRRAGVRDQDLAVFVDTVDEPKTDGIDRLFNGLDEQCEGMPPAIIGLGGGATLDTAKAIANLWTNGGRAADYQGWDLVKKPGIYKIGVPTISGTGAESSRTCVMTNTEKGLKLGMNSDHTIFDQLVLDPELTVTVPRDQYFYTGLDTYIHCIESLGGRLRNPVGDAFSRQALELSRDIFLSEDMKADEAREKLMVASYLGGCAIAHSLVGLVHPFSAGLSVVMGYHHGIGNCIALRGLGEFYPEAVEEFEMMLDKQGVGLPQDICRNLSDEQHEQLFQATVIHEKPLQNALGEQFKSILTRDRVREIFLRM